MESSSTQRIALRPHQINLLETLAGVNEKFGLQPAMAKVLALLTVSDETELTFDQIQESLSLSKGATSQAINGLLLLKKIEYKTRIGARKRYFFNRVISWQDLFTETLQRYAELQEVHQQVLNQRPLETVLFNQNIQEMIGFLSLLNREVPALFAQFKEKLR